MKEYVLFLTIVMFCLANATRESLTFTVLNYVPNQDSNIPPNVFIAMDTTSDPHNGDTNTTEILPVLCVDMMLSLP